MGKRKELQEKNNQLLKMFLSSCYKEIPIILQNKKNVLEAEIFNRDKEDTNDSTSILLNQELLMTEKLLSYLEKSSNDSNFINESTDSLLLMLTKKEKNIILKEYPDIFNKVMSSFIDLLKDYN